jgi:hypothetical protein
MGGSALSLDRDRSPRFAKLTFGAAHQYGLMFHVELGGSDRATGVRSDGLVSRETERRMWGPDGLGDAKPSGGRAVPLVLIDAKPRDGRAVTMGLIDAKPSDRRPFQWAWRT